MQTVNQQFTLHNDINCCGTIGIQMWNKQDSRAKAKMKRNVTQLFKTTKSNHHAKQQFILHNDINCCATIQIQMPNKHNSRAKAKMKRKTHQRARELTGEAADNPVMRQNILTWPR